MALSSSGIVKGTEKERAAWKKWAQQRRLTDENGVFCRPAVDERRARFRVGLEKRDVHDLDVIELLLIDTFHFRNAMTERWPETIRVMLNRVEADGQDEKNVPFESWYGPPGLEKRRQSTRVWTELVQFLVLEYHIHNITWTGDNALLMKGSQGNLPDMGLFLSDDMRDDIMDVISGSFYGRDVIKSAIQSMCLSLVMHASTNPRCNPLLFWVGLILQTEEFGEQPRFAFNKLQDTLSTREKLEALVHYARVLVIDHAFFSWSHLDSVSKEWQESLQRALNLQKMGWVDEGTPRPAAQEGDPSDFDVPYWRSFIDHFDQLSKRWLTKGSESPIGVILKLLDA